MYKVTIELITDTPDTGFHADQITEVESLIMDGHPSGELRYMDGDIITWRTEEVE